MREGASPGAADAQAAVFDLDGIVGTHARAVGQMGVVEHRFQIADEVVTLRFAGAALVDLLTPAFAHLAVEEGSKPGLVINLWDSISTGVEAPPLPSIPADAPFGAFYYYEERPYRALFQPGPRALSMFDADAREAWYWVEGAANLSHWECAAPARHILQWYVRSTGRQQVHGGAVGTPDGGVLLVGKGGSGKSTATLSTLNSDLLYAGDDYVAVQIDDPPVVHSLYSSGKVEPHHLGRLPHLGSAVWNQDKLQTEKAVVYVHQHWPERTSRGFPLRAVLIPKVAADRPESRITEASRAMALAALAPSTIFQLHPSGQEALAAMARVVERVPTHTLELGSDIAGIPRAISELLGGQ
ncbi:MAG: serine kinase [Actinobacteria bacterium]|nr:serine kinase [Actinomycetota bacterium]